MGHDLILLLAWHIVEGIATHITQHPAGSPPPPRVVVNPHASKSTGPSSSPESSGSSSFSGLSEATYVCQSP